VVTKLIPGARFDPAKATAMVCGPEVMMRFAAAALEERGVAKDRIHVSMERSMHCAIGLCGHCQLRELFICKDGPVFPLERIEPLLRAREL
jgi:NAD(P)H-flavin reductase